MHNTTFKLAFLHKDDDKRFKGRGWAVLVVFCVQLPSTLANVQKSLSYIPRQGLVALQGNIIAQSYPLFKVKQVLSFKNLFITVFYTEAI